MCMISIVYCDIKACIITGMILELSFVARGAGEAFWFLRMCFNPRF